MSIPPGRTLYEGEDRYQSVVDAMSEGVILQDASSAILACNRAAEQLLGLTTDELVGRTSRDPRWRTIHEDGTPFVGDAHPVPVSLRTGQAQRGIVMGVHKPDGTLTWLSVNSEPLFREGETAPHAALCTFSDVTQQKLAEHALRQSEERYRGIVETTLEGVWMIDLTGETFFANRRMAELLGCTLDELLASSVWDFVDERDRDDVEQRLERRRDGISEHHDFCLRRKDRGAVWVNMATSPITLPDGSKGALAMVRDVSERCRMEAELRASKERLELALSAGMMGTWEWSSSGGEASVSNQLREILGVDHRDPLAPSEMLRHVHPEDRDALERSMTSYVGSDSRERFVNNFRVVRSDGAVRHVSATGRMTSRGDERALLGTMVDLTESRAMQEKLEQAQQLERIGRLAGGVAHDFNNLLTVVLTVATLAQRDAPPRIAEDLRTIISAAERGAALTKQLLAFARKQIIRLTSLELNTIVMSLASMLRRLVGDDITIVEDLDPGLWMVRGDATQIEQAILNLVVNARDAMPDGGQIRVTTRNATMSADHASRLGLAGEEHVTISVRDAGAGIDPTIVPRIFEPFFTTKQSGTGLGLASTYGIVQQLGGQIEVSSELGRGTTFTIRFPRDRLSAPAEVPARSAAAMPRPATILFVEDEPQLRAVVVRSLRSFGHHVLVAGDGEEAIVVAEAHAGTIDLVITDVVMPRKSGRQLADALARTRPMTRVLFVSGYTNDIIAQKGILEPQAHFLAKPYSLEALQQRIAALVKSPVPRD